MKKISSLSFCILLISFFFSGKLFAQAWSAEQLEKANTAKNTPYLNQDEKEVVKYLNLARLYPQQFLETELRDYNGPEKYGGYLKDSPYKASLIAEMTTMSPLGIINPDSDLYNFAKCFAKESGDAGSTGHNRVACAQMQGAWGECCSYGMETGKDIVLQLLIDHDVSSLGHRHICLSKDFSTVGVGIWPHKVYQVCSVLDFK